MHLFSQLQIQATQLKPKRISVAAAHDEEVLEAIIEATKQNIATFCLYGNGPIIEQMLADRGYNPSTFEIVHTDHDQLSCKLAVQSVNEGLADIVMKGLVNTSDILRAVLNKEYGLRTDRVLSHVALFEVAHLNRFIFVTDAAMNIAPDLLQKKHIIQNAIDVSLALGIKQPKVALIAAVESVNPDMQATMDAAILAKMADRGQIKGGLVDGPLALDNAISIEAAAHKKIESPVAGQADILVVPSIEVGNALYKSMVYFAQAQVGAIIAGAAAPIILTSRADSSEAKLNSIILAVMDAHYRALHNNAR